MSSPPPPHRILVVGDAFVDVHAGPLADLPTWGTNTVSPEPIAAMPGGAALNVASWLQRLLGGGVVLYTGIGRDSFGDLLRAHCAALGLELWEAAAEAGAPTGVCMVLSGREDRAFCSHFGVSDTFDAEALGVQQLREFRHVHASGFFSCAALRRSLPALFRRAHEAGPYPKPDPDPDPDPKPNPDPDPNPNP